MSSGAALGLYAMTDCAHTERAMGNGRAMSEHAAAHPRIQRTCWSQPQLTRRQVRSRRLQGQETHLRPAHARARPHPQRLPWTAHRTRGSAALTWSTRGWRCALSFVCIWGLGYLLTTHAATMTITAPTGPHPSCLSAHPAGWQCLSGLCTLHDRHISAVLWHLHGEHCALWGVSPAAEFAACTLNGHESGGLVVNELWSVVVQIVAVAVEVDRGD
jgi:hypothetical protein